MRSFLEEIYNEIFDNVEEYRNVEACEANSKETAELLKQFKEILRIEQRDLFAKLWRSVLESDYEVGFAHFKGGFKMGFKLACECLKV